MPANKKAAAPTLAKAAAQQKASKRKPIYKDVAGIPRVPLSDGTVGCVQAEVLLSVNDAGEIVHASGPQLLTIPRTNADGSESGQRFPLAAIQLLADGFRAAGIELV